ncbi:MAG: menaquinone biosynthesis decarboxylase [Acidobacteria bacterium]|nr:menaquinone biosynthesis decarboxylase [Acidobacteriota bacterium]
MAYRDLSDFVASLEKEGDLLRVKDEVDPYLEVTEILDRAVKEGGPAVLFEKIKGHSVPVLGNVMGTHRRMLKALGIKSYEEADARIEAFFDVKQPQGILDKLKMLPQLAELASFMPKSVKGGPCKEVILRKGQFSLKEIPICTCWPQDGGPYITLPMVFTKDRESGKRNCGMYRMQLYDETTTGMHWHMHKHGAKHARQRQRAGEKMEVAVAIGSDPATYFCAAMPVPDDVDEMLLAGFIRKEAVEMVKCETVDLEVPANAEYVLEGWVDPNELRREGPFGDHTGYYSLEDDYPVFHVECVTRRKNPLYVHTIVGRPPMEDCYMGYAIERVTLPILKRQMPEIVNVHMPFEGVFHNLMLISIDKQYPGHARKVMHAIWGLGQAMFTKVIVVVDKDVNLLDSSEVAWKALNNIDPSRDLELARGPMDVLDHASQLMGYGGKVGIDATRKWPGEGFNRPWPDVIANDPKVVAKMGAMWEKLKKR